MSKILLIEDDECTIAVVRWTLASQHQLILTSTLAQARQHLEVEEFQVIILDVLLPDGNGFDFISELKNSQKLKTIPVLFITGRSSQADQDRGLSLGAAAYLIKPVYPDVLQENIKKTILQATAA